MNISGWRDVYKAGVGSIDARLMRQYFAAMKHTAEFFKSLADETRLRLLLLLHEGREHCVCDLMHALDMPQSTVSRHLAYLKRSGWLQDRRGGVWMYYSLNRERDGFFQAQLALLVNRLADNEVSRRDRERLVAYLRGKDANNCG